MKTVRGVLCWMMIASFPASLMAADSGAGMVRPYGAAWLNGVAVEQSSTIFPGDLVQTSSKSALDIRSSGSSVTVLSDSVVKFAGDAVQVERGGVKLVTSKGMFASAGIITATPASNAWTEFQLTHVDGAVQILALKGDLQISDGTQTTTLPQGQQATQKDSDDKTAAAPDSGAIPPVKGRRKKKAAVIILAAGGAAATGGAVAWALSSGGSPRVISPITP
jgi:hypothetical protein